jgi:hypothetical protein
MMSVLISAVKFKNLDEARRVLREVSGRPDLEVFDDAGAEPQGLLAVVPEDRVDEETFYRLFGQKRGASIKVERIPYSGYGPPAEEPDYMGFISEQTAYVVKGRRLPIEIENCPDGATDIHHLEALVMDRLHPLNRADLAKRLDLSRNWDFDDLFDLIVKGQLTAQDVDRLIHQGIQ